MESNILCADLVSNHPTRTWNFWMRAKLVLNWADTLSFTFVAIELVVWGTAMLTINLEHHAPVWKQQVRHATSIWHSRDNGMYRDSLRTFLARILVRQADL